MARIKQITSLKAKIRKLNTDTIIGFFAIFWLILIFIGFFLLPNNVFAMMIEDFDSYAPATILETGIGNWGETLIYPPLTVYDTQYYSEFRAMSNLSTGGSQLILSENIQELNFKFYLSSCGAQILFTVYDEETDMWGDYFAGCKVEDFNGECVFTGFGDPPVFFWPIDIVGVWHTFIIQQAGENVRYSINNGVDFTDWTKFWHGGVARNIYSFQVRTTAGSYENYFYLDDISAPSVCQIGSCNICQNYIDCEASGCFWWHSIYQPGGLWGGETGGWCIEPYEPDPEECGALFKCQFCMSQATCEAEYCEWVDRYGTGEKCYIPEPEIPLTQTGWEVPDLEDCAPLGGVEKWLCEIFNFGSGIYMPSQEKINSLYYTMGAFKDRFPFSYAESLNRFFSEIKTSFDEEKSIPIEILGQESEIDFVFWDNTTIIGGHEESFKNVIFDFTSFIVIFAWFLWLISLIKRFL